MAMTILRVVTAAMVAGTIGWAGEVHSLDRTVDVCVAMGEDFAVQRAQSIAAGMFLQAGVRIEWHRDRSCPQDAIRVSFSDGTNRNFRPEAVAYALPYEASHIVVFYDRLRQHGSARLPVVLAHVLVHEITHMLQGVCRHSESGVMKARWTTREYDEMAFQPLPFTPADVLLIHMGLDARESRLAAAK
jgi:hypothetical protein